MPIRGSRALYKIPLIQVGENAAGTGGRSIVVKIKEPIADFLSLQRMAYDDPDLIGTFGGSGSNAGFKYVKRLGGFRYVSFKVVAKTTFTISEIVRQANGTFAPQTKQFKSFSMGFPRGVSVREFINWIATTGVLGEIDYIVTPSGTSHPLGPSGS